MVRPTAPTATGTSAHLGENMRRSEDGLTTLGLRPPSVRPSPEPFSSYLSFSSHVLSRPSQGPPMTDALPMI